MFELTFARLKHLQSPNRLKDAMEIVAKEADRLVPVDTGALKNSQEIHDDAIVYTAPYGVYVHEDLTARHPHGEAKFLEKAWRNKRSDFMKKFTE